MTTMLTDNSSTFCSLLKSVHFDLLSGDGGTATRTICVNFFVFRFAGET